MTNPRVLGTLTTGLRPPRVWVLEETAGPESLGHLSPAVWVRPWQQSALRWLWGRSRGLNRPLLRVGKERRSLLRGRCCLLLLSRLLVEGLLLSLRRGPTLLPHLTTTRKIFILILVWKAYQKKV